MRRVLFLLLILAFLALLLAQVLVSPGHATDLRVAMTRTGVLVHDDASAGVDAGQLADDLRFGVDHISLVADELVTTGWGSWSEAHTWCESVESTPCQKDNECGSKERCVQPWWSDSAEVRVCAEKWPSKDAREWRRDRLRTIVDMTCSRRRGCDPRQLHSLLSIVALRESTWRPSKRHRLNPDLESAMKAWRRRAGVFASNPYYREMTRWSTGVGMYGMNPAIFVDAWDREAPPEVLCREVEATAAYLERARRAVRGFHRRGISPTICDVHHAVSGGKLEPCSDASRFRARAERAGLDASAVVTESSFGEAPPRARAARLAWAEAIHSAVEGVHPPL